MEEYTKIARAIEYIQANFKQQPSLDQVAEQVHVSSFHFQRMFTEWAGVSPKKFLQFISFNYAKTLLTNKSASLADVAYETGLSGTSRLHDLFVNIEAMTPGDYKNAGKGLIIHYSYHQGPFGKFLLATTDKGICNLSFTADEQEALPELMKQWPNARLMYAPEINSQIADSVFSPVKQADRPLILHLKGSSFQLKVWEALLRIPEGALSNYSAIAAEIGSPDASRAVGTAIGQNPVAYLIPCHRVIKKVGGIGEYRWGSVRKMAMIGWEASRKYNLEFRV